MSIDLHIHSNISDGIYTPEQIGQKAKKRKLKAFSLTDHDTIEGIEIAARTAKKAGIEFIPGVEISAKWKFGMLHILGYYIDISNEYLLNGLVKLQEARKKRNPKIIKKLNDLGIKITMKQVKEQAKGGVIGRPNIARVMIENGYVENIKSAFNKYLDNGKPAFVPKEKMNLVNACDIIKKSRGIPVLAHPLTLGFEGDNLAEIITRFKDSGIEGIEAIYPEHSAKETEFFIDIAKKLGMLITGGSDFHDNQDKGVFPGCVKVDYKYLIEMKKFLNIK